MADFFIDDVVAGCAVAKYCSNANAVASTPRSLKGTELTSDLPGSFAGSLNFSLQNNLVVPGAACMMYELPVGNYKGWDGVGDWTVSLMSGGFVMGANVNLMDIHICKVDSGCSNPQSLGSKTGIDYHFGVSDLQSYIITGSAFTLNSSDKILVVFTFINRGVANESGFFIGQLSSANTGWVLAPLTTQAGPVFRRTTRPAGSRIGTRIITDV